MCASHDNGLPDGIHTDVVENVWAGGGDGIHVWSSEGMLLGKLGVEGGCEWFRVLAGWDFGGECGQVVVGRGVVGAEWEGGCEGFWMPWLKVGA